MRFQSKRRFLNLVMLAAVMMGRVSFAEEFPDEPVDFESLIQQAQQQFQAANYNESIRFLERAYELDPQPIIIYNIGRAYERSIQLERAIENYERFLSLGGTTSELRARVMTNLRNLREEIATRDQLHQRQVAQPEDEQTTPQPPAEQSEARSPEPLVASVQLEQEPLEEQVVDQVQMRRDRRTRALTIAGWSLIATGGAALVIGGALGIAAIQRNNSFEETWIADERFSLRDERDRYALSADILYISGATLSIVGIVLVVIAAIRSRRGAGNEEDVELSRIGRLSADITAISFTGIADELTSLE